jgi:hypothetical protein
MQTSISSISKKLEALKQQAAALLQEDAPALDPLSFADFLMREFLPSVSEIEGELVPAPHLREWADLIEKKPFRRPDRVQGLAEEHGRESCHCSHPETAHARGL